MALALADKSVEPFRIPSGIKLVRVNPDTGYVARPGESSSILEAFKTDTNPPEAANDGGNPVLGDGAPALGSIESRPRRGIY